jgi:hypothetical protein
MDYLRKHARFLVYALAIVPLLGLTLTNCSSDRGNQLTSFIPGPIVTPADDNVEDGGTGVGKDPALDDQPDSDIPTPISAPTANPNLTPNPAPTIDLGDPVPAPTPSLVLTFTLLENRDSIVVEVPVTTASGGDCPGGVVSGVGALSAIVGIITGGTGPYTATIFPLTSPLTVDVPANPVCGIGLLDGVDATVGVNLNAVLLSGGFTTLGTADYQITVTDANGDIDSEIVSITVQGAATN